METSFSNRKLSQNCDLFIYKKNSSKFTTPNEDLLKLYMNDLTKIYNQSFNTNAINDILQFNSSGRNSQLQNKFKLCKEKAFHYLQKSEQINSYLESVMFGADSKYISEKDIKKLVDNQHVKVQTEFNNLVNLYKNFEIVFTDSNFERLDNFISQGFVELKLSVDQIIDFLSNSDNQSAEHFKNLIIFSAPKSAISSVLDTFLKINLKNILTQKENCDSYVKVLRVNFEALISLPIDSGFIENLVNSINLYKIKHRVNVFLILENLELLFEQKFFENFRVRFLGDLLYELGAQDKSIDNIQSNRLFFTILSERPWSLPSALIQQFEKKIFCGPTSQQDTNVICRQGFKTMQKKLKRNWLFENFEEFSRKENLIELISNLLVSFIMTEKLLKELFPLLEKFLIDLLEEILNASLEKENMVNVETFDLYRKQAEKTSWYKTKTKVRLVPKLSLRKNSFAFRKKSSIVNQMKKNEKFENLKNEIWNLKSDLIKKKIIEFCLNFLKTNQIPSDLEKLYKCFQNKYIKM